MRLISFALLMTCITLSACGSSKKEAPKIGDLTQRLTMFDAEGRNFGTVELDPINGGKIYDAQGRLIGRVVTPAQGPAVSPVLQ